MSHSNHFLATVLMVMTTLLVLMTVSFTHAKDGTAVNLINESPPTLFEQLNDDYGVSPILSKPGEPLMFWWIAVIAVQCAVIAVLAGFWLRLLYRQRQKRLRLEKLPRQQTHQAADNVEPISRTPKPMTPTRPKRPLGSGLNSSQRVAPVSGPAIISPQNRPKNSTAMAKHSSQLDIITEETPSTTNMMMPYNKSRHHIDTEDYKQDDYKIVHKTSSSSDTIGKSGQTGQISAISHLNSGKSLGAQHLPDPDPCEEFNKLKHMLPSPRHPEYPTYYSWVTNLIENNFQISPYIIPQLGKSMSLIDTRTKEEIMSSQGYIPGSDWFPHDDPNHIQILTSSFPKDTLIGLISTNETIAHETITELKSTGHMLAAEVTGGIRNWNTMGFQTTRDPSILENKNRPLSVEFHEKILHNFFTGSEKTLEPITEDEVCRHVNTVGNIQWISTAGLLLNGNLSCIDGRSAIGIMGTPGGDMGEFIVQLSTAESLMQRALTESEIEILFKRHLDTFGLFYMHTDQKHAFRFAEQLGTIDGVVNDIKNECDPQAELKLHRILRSIPCDKLHRALKIFVKPGCTGCGHLQLVLADPGKYGIFCKKSMKTALKCFLTAFLRPEDTECQYIVLLGKHAETGVFDIELDRPVQFYSKIPLLSSRVGVKSAYISHAKITKFIRGIHSNWMLDQDDLVKLPCTTPEEYKKFANNLADQQAYLTVSKLAHGNPIFTIAFPTRGTTPLITDSGVVLPPADQVPNTSQDQQSQISSKSHRPTQQV